MKLSVYLVCQLKQQQQITEEQKCSVAYRVLLIERNRRHDGLAKYPFTSPPPPLPTPKRPKKIKSLKKNVIKEKCVRDRLVEQDWNLGPLRLPLVLNADCERVQTQTISAALCPVFVSPLCMQGNCNIESSCQTAVSSRRKTAGKGCS